MFKCQCFNVVPALSISEQVQLFITHRTTHQATNIIIIVIIIIFHPLPFRLPFLCIPSLHPMSLLVIIIIIIQARGPISFLLVQLVDHSYMSHLSIYQAFLSSSSSFLTKMPMFTTTDVDNIHPSVPDVAAMRIVTTNTNCTHPSLPPFQSPTTDLSPPRINNEEVVVLGVVSPSAEAITPAVSVAINSTCAAGKKDTEVSFVITFFNPQSKNPRCITPCDCFNITSKASGGITIACKMCLNFWVSNCFLLLSEHLNYFHTIVLSSSMFKPGHGGPSTYLLHEDMPCNGQEWQLKCVLVSFRIDRLKD
jgi:hypothetical protein